MILLLIYGFISAIVLTRGIGLERLLIFSKAKFDIFYYIRNFVIALLASYITYIYMITAITSWLLFLLPLVLLGSLLFLEWIEEKLFKIKTLAKKEKNFLYGISLLAVFEAHSFASVIVLLPVGFLSLMFCDVLLKAINKVLASRPTNYYLRLVSLSLISLGIISAIISAL